MESLSHKKKKKKKKKKKHKKMKMKSLRTPDNVRIGHDVSMKEISSKMNSEISSHQCWTDECTKLLKSNAHALFLYDRMECAIGKAYGSSDLKILINPVMVMCYHPKCLKQNRIVRLKVMLDLTRYAEHLLDHDDEIGVAMQTRFEAIAGSPFITEDHLDKINHSPYSLQPNISLSKETKKVLKCYGIDRKLKSSYICHWKDVLIRQKLINSASLSYQEDDALVFTVLHYPNPVRDWAIYSTLSFYCLKFLAAVGESGLNLYRGTTQQRVVHQKKIANHDLRTFIADINHPGPSVTTLQNVLPQLLYENKTLHKKETIFHMKLLEKVETSVAMKFPLVTRYPATLGIDEQELNSGVYVHNGKLHGLEKPMTPQEILEVGLKNLAKYIAEKNFFINAAREYRLTDFKGIFCSNVFTWFISKTLTSEDVIDDLKRVVLQASVCLHCLKNDLVCVYDDLDQQCTECLQLGIHCTSMFVSVTLWDMGSSHKKTAIEMPSLNSSSHGRDLYRRDMFSFIFGGLHLCKACVNASRNHVLTYDGSNYGIHILRQLKHQFDEMFQGVKTAVLVGKDRQSDLLSNRTCNDDVQGILNTLKTYEITRVPENILTYTENAKTQKRIISPIALAANKNGDVFIMDKGAACIHVVDRSSVAKVTILGKYEHPSTGDYGTKTGIFKAKDILLSSGISDMVIANDILYVSDQERNEVGIVYNCAASGSVNSCRFQIMKIEACVSLAFANENLIVLRKDSQSSIIEVLAMPAFQKTDKSLFVSSQMITSLRPASDVKSLFMLPQNYFGAHTAKKTLKTYEILDGEVSHVSEISSSKCRPCLTGANQIITIDADSVSNLLLNKLEISNTDSTIECIERISCRFTPLLICSWGKTVFMISNRGVNDFILVEIGKLDFGMQFCRSINTLYKAVSYVPPHGDASCRCMKLSECIALATESVALLNKMQTSLEERFTGRKSFVGSNGAIFTQTINCINSSIDSLKAVEIRLKELNSGSDVCVYCHALMNESYVEHSFGDQTQQGQGQLQNQEEYCQSKRRRQVNFQIKMCNTPFNQYSKVKKRDQGYQAVGKRDIPLTIDDIKEIFSDSVQKQAENPTVIENDQKILRCAFNLAKSVPRQSNRCKWREKSGYAPNLLQESESNSSKLFAGDLVFFQSLDNKLLNLFVTEDVVLSDLDMSLKVKMIHSDDDERIFSVKLSQLFQDGGHTVAIPSNMYTIEDEGLRLDDNVSYMFDGIRYQQTVSRTDTEWDLLLDVFCETTENQVQQQVNAAKTVTNSEDVEAGGKGKKKRQRRTPRNENSEDVDEAGGKGKKKRQCRTAKNNANSEDIETGSLGTITIAGDDQSVEVDREIECRKRRKTVPIDDESETDDDDVDCNKRKISNGYYVEVVDGRFVGYFATVVGKSCANVWDVNYFHKQYGKWVLKRGDLDSRNSQELKVVIGKPEIGTRDRFTFEDFSPDST